MICDLKKNGYMRVFIKNQIIDTAKTWFKDVHDIPVRVVVPFIIFCLSFQWTHYLLYICEGYMYQEFRRHKTKNTQLIAMNFIMIILAENVFYNKFSASIKFLNAMHVKAKYFTIKYSGANSATIYVYATSLSKVVWLEYYPLALNHIWCLETHEENCLIPLLIIWNKNWTCILCPEINRKTQEIPLSA